MRKVECTCTATKQCKHCYDKIRRRKIKKGKWKFNVPMPNQFTSKQKQVLIGGLLGDFYLYQNKNHINAGLVGSRAYKDKKYAQYELDVFKNFCNGKVGKTSYLDKRTNKTYHRAWFRTRVSRVFTSYKQKWYPNGTKIVPRDLQLTPLICAIWFCDDGSVIYKNKNNLRLQFATDGFTKSDVKFLAKLLAKELGADFKVYPKEGHYVIHAYTEATIKFIHYIKPCFPSSMKRKSDNWKGIC